MMRKTVLYTLLFVFVLKASAFAALVKMPVNMDLEATSSTITVTWTANTHTDDDGFDITQGYFIRWQENNAGNEHSVKIVGIGTGAQEYTIYALNKDTSYTVTLSAYSGGSESNGDEKSIITDNVRDVTIKIVITGIDEVSVSLEDAGSSVEQFAVVVVRDSDGVTIFNGLDFTVNPKKAIDEAQIITGFSNEEYSFTVTIFPDNDALAVQSFTFEDTHTFLSNADDSIEGGCFVNTSYNDSITGLFYFITFLTVSFLIAPGRLLKIGFPFLILFLYVTSTESMAKDEYLYKNNFGIKGGLFLANESEQKDVYEEIVPFSLFYERMFTEHFSADIDLGYSKSDGTALSASSTSTELVTELEMYPAAVSVNFNYDVAPYITAYLGAGGDWWLVEEKSELGEFKSEVGGWHAKTGLKIFSDELETFKQVGFLMEVSYAEIDRFGNNDIDLGGWKFNIGLMYCL